MGKEVKNKNFELGSCYYPEHWPEELWADDFRRMMEMNFTTIRIGEFAWSIFEPNEGEFTFEFFDKAINLAHEYGLKVVMGTPTATPPAWLSHNYPEILNVSKDGVQFQHGQRRHYNYNSKIYQFFSERIVRKIVDHYKDHPAIIGWQIDNELNCETNVFYSEADHLAFRQWVKNKYKTLENLNKAWGTVFWNQTYSDWEQIYLTRPVISDSPNPHHALDEKRFFSDSAISFAKMQADIIKELAPSQWVTTNGLFGHLDNHKMTNDILDFFAYDSYPNFSTIYPDKGDNPLLDRKWSWNLSNVRSISPSFAVFEQQSGPGGWVTQMEQPSPKPGQMRLWTYQSIAHGADMLLYFRWRTATKGTEIYWHGINDYHNRPNRRVREAAQIGNELKLISSQIKGAKYQAEVAILRDYDNEWDGEMDLWHGPFSSKSNIEWFKALQFNHIPSDVAYMNQDTAVSDLTRYKLLIYPHPAIMSEATANLLKEYVSQGGKVVFGSRSGYKDQTGECYTMPFPGMLGELCGVSIEEFSFLVPNEQGPKFVIGEEQYEGTGFSEVLHVESSSVEIMARYNDRYYLDKPVLSKNSFGQGNAYYFGGVFTRKVAEFILEDAGIETPVSGILALPESIELSIRRDSAGNEYIFLLNYSDEAQQVQVKKERKNLFSGELVKDDFTIEPFGVVILTK